MHEVVAYIKSNSALIEAITISKVNVNDIVDNLDTNVSNRPLSAAQGVALKALIDAIAVPTKVSELTNDKGYLTEITLQNVSKALGTGALETQSKEIVGAINEVNSKIITVDDVIAALPRYNGEVEDV